MPIGSPVVRPDSPFTMSRTWVLVRSSLLYIPSHIVVKHIFVLVWKPAQWCFSLSDGSVLGAVHSLTICNQAARQRCQLSVVRIPTLHITYIFWAELLHLPSISWRNSWVGFLLSNGILNPWRPELARGFFFLIVHLNYTVLHLYNSSHLQRMNNFSFSKKWS